jgi:hypothetical protein
MSTMSKQRKQKAPAAQDEPEPVTVYVRLDAATSGALARFVGSQDVPPTNPAVVVKALHEFLARRGYWPPPSAA